MVVPIHLAERRPGRALPGIVAALILQFTSACSSTDPGYFPLGDKHLWTYRVQRTIKGEERRQKFVVASMSPAIVDGATFFPLQRLDGRIELYEKSAGGIYRVDGARRARAHILPERFEPGVKWRSDSRILFLEVTGAFSPTFQERVSSNITLDFVIEAVDDPAEVPAGRFTGCLRVKGSGSMFAGSTLESFMGIRFIKVEQTEWYAPGVGLVKRVRNEYTTPAEWSNAYIEELESVR
ncbi:MAG: hypothetical protein ACREUU_04080 [Gammaproteobacteria bacterium]